MKILICGDYIVHDQLQNAGPEVFGDFLATIRGADISIYNQEHPVTRSKEIYPAKQCGTVDACDPESLHPILGAGFTCATLATNHILNRGASGIADTLAFLRRNRITPLGAGATLAEAKETVYIARDGVALALLNMAENEFCSATRRHAGAHPMDVVDNVRSIREAKFKADHVVVILHGGLEYCRYPTPRQVAQSRFYVENGASAVIWHHSHYVSGYERYLNCTIHYGVGNFIPAKPIPRFLLDPLARQSCPVQLETSADGFLRCTVFPLSYDIRKGRLEPMGGNELRAFQEFQVRIQGLLDDPEVLKAVIVKECLPPETLASYLLLFMRSNRHLLRIARRLGLTGLLLRRLLRKLEMDPVNTASWNLLRCETHRDVLGMIYDRFVDTYDNR